MPKYRPLKYRDVVTILRNLGFTQEVGGATSHQIWILRRKNKFFAVTLSFHGTNVEFKRGTLQSIIRQSGFAKRQFFDALQKTKKR